MDKISSLIGRHTFNARVFFNGDFCDTNEFVEDDKSGHLHLVRKGPVIFSHREAPAIRIDEPTMVYYPRGTGHRLQVPEGESATLLCATISFQDGSQNLLARVLPECLRLPLAERTMLGATLELLFAEASAAAAGRDVILDRLCDVLMVQMIRYQFESGAMPTGLLAGLADKQLSLALVAMHERPQEPWDLHSLGGVACMSRTRFAEHFRAIVGTAPGEYLTQCRIRLARHLLLQGMPVKAVSAKTGYASAAAFTRAFTKYAGMSPRQWGRAPGGAGD